MKENQIIEVLQPNTIIWVQHDFVNPDELVQAVSCTQKHIKSKVTLTFDLW